MHPLHQVQEWGTGLSPAGGERGGSPLCHPTCVTLGSLETPVKRAGWGSAHSQAEQVADHSFTGHYKPCRSAPRAGQAPTGRTPTFPRHKGGFGEEFCPGAASHEPAPPQEDMWATAGAFSCPQASCHTSAHTPTHPPTHPSPLPAHPRLRFPSILLLFLQQAPLPHHAGAARGAGAAHRCCPPPPPALLGGNASVFFLPPSPSPFSHSILNFYCILFKEYRGTNALISNSHKV